MSAFVAEIARAAGPVRATGIANPHSGSWIVGDVRLDGRERLRDALGAAGIPTAGKPSDVDLVLAAWTAWRETATERLIGTFSFALWDSDRRVLFCARDQLGVRPLYWAHSGDAFICGNVLDEVLAHRRVSRRLHEAAIVSFLACGYNADTATTSFADVRRLEPAQQMSVNADSMVGRTRTYWSLPVPEPLRLSGEQEYIERFREVLGDAVRDRIGVDRAAILLSGGLDSTCLAATARRVAPATALSAWTEDKAPAASPDETRLAAAVAAELRLDHQIVREMTAPLSHLASPTFRTPEPLDEPAWSSWIALAARISASAGVLVMGDDGDALFRPPGLLTMLRTWPGDDLLRRVLSYSIAHRRHPHLGVWLRRGFRSPFMRRDTHAPAWIRRDVLSRREASPPPARHPARPDAARYLTDPIWQSVLEPAQFAYTGLPLRFVWPLMDTRVIEFVFSIPPVPWCQNKELMRRSFAGELPREVLERPKSPLAGYFEKQVIDWRANTSRSQPSLGERVREFVDTRRVTDTLQRGTVGEVHAAWRVLALDQWLQHCDRPAES